MSLHHIFGWCHALLSGKKNPLRKRKKEGNTRHRWHWARRACLSLGCCAAWRNCGSRKAGTAGLTQWSRFLVPLSHHKGEAHSWGQGLTSLDLFCVFICSHRLFLDLEQSLLSSSQPLGHRHCFHFWRKSSKSLVGGWVRSIEKLRGGTKHFPWCGDSAPLLWLQWLVLITLEE